MKYNNEHCNIKDCKCKIYKNYLCKEHYDFYIRDDKAKQINNEIALLQKHEADFRTKLKKIRHWLGHYIMSIPMSLIEHFPLEHIFLHELHNVHKENSYSRCCQILNDFNIPENENYAVMEKLVKEKFISEIKLDDESEYFLSKKEKPSLVLLLIAFAGCLLLSLLFTQKISICFLDSNFSEKVKDIYNQYFIYVIGLMICITISYYIPKLYQPLIKKAYDLSLFVKVENNIKFLLSVQYVKHRNDRTYLLSLSGVLLAFCFFCYEDVYDLDTSFSFYSLLIYLSLLMIFVPLSLWISTFILYSPIFESMKWHSIQIDLYNTDFYGGMTSYHYFLFLTFLYNEGLISVLFNILREINLPWYAFAGLVILVIPRCNHAGASLYLYVKSIFLFYKIKRREKQKLLYASGTESMYKQEMLDKVSPVKMLRLILQICVLCVLPYIINHLPEPDVLLNFINKNVLPIINVFLKVF